MTGPLVLEATALPTEPQPLLFHNLDTPFFWNKHELIQVIVTAKAVILKISIFSSFQHVTIKI